MLLWQVSHGAFVVMCFAGFAVAVAPLWHLTQFATIPVWFMRAPANVAVLLWQLSQGALVTTWFGRLPVAATPLWQVAQPLMKPAWLGFVGAAGALDDVWVLGGFDKLVSGGTVLVALAAGALDDAWVLGGFDELVSGGTVLVALAAGVVATAGGVVAVDAAAFGGSGRTTAPLNVTVLRWQVLHGALVTMCWGVLPVANLLLWQLAQGASAWT